MGLFGFGKKKAESARQKPSAEKNETLNLKSILNEEEIRLLVTDLNTVAGKVPSDKRSIVTAMADLVQKNGTIPMQGLSLCIAAVQESLGTFAAFGLAPSGHTALLEKLKKLG